MEGIIISGFAGIGKTTIAEKYQNRIIDLESSDFKWVYEDDTTANMSKELYFQENKGNKKGIDFIKLR